MRHARLHELQAGIKTGRRNINILRYVNDTTPMAESKEELKSLLMRVRKESEKAGWKLNNQKLRLWHLVLSLHANINRGKSGSNNTFYFLGLQNHCGW